MDANNFPTLMSLVQQTPPPPPPSPPPSANPLHTNLQRTPDSTICSGNDDDEEEEEDWNTTSSTQPQLRQTRTYSAPTTSLFTGHFFPTPPSLLSLPTTSSSMSSSSTPPMDPTPRQSRKRHRRTLLGSPPRKVQVVPRDPSPEYPPIYIINADGEEEINPEAYKARGFGWVNADHPTRRVWSEFCAAGIDSTKSAGGMYLINKNYSNWSQPGGYQHHVWQRANSQPYSPNSSRSDTPVGSPFQSPDESVGSPVGETPLMLSPISDFGSTCTPSPARSPTPDPPRSPSPSPSRSVSRSPRTDESDSPQSPVYE